MYNEFAMNVAEKILSSDGSREEMIKLLQDMGKPLVYGNEDFDRKQILATLLTKLGAR